MARYEPKHLKRKSKRKKVIRIRGNKKGLGFILVTALFITFVMFSTFYSVFIYPTTLPKVDVMKIGDTNQSSSPIITYSFPVKAIQYDEKLDKHYCYYVTEEIGGWGYRYFVHRKEVIFSNDKSGSNHASVLLIGGHDNFYYVISDASCLLPAEEVIIQSILNNHKE